ncbi:MAG TPA: RIP metalloprotease [Beutenbergiaceae bacterium]|nr:RIP metalloprotease [Beutenbergiaceae bacterium]
MSFWIGVGLLVLGLIVSIGLHELGHLVPAKRFRVYVPQYFIGFGPTLWSTKRGETEYGVKLLPLGGFVRLAGMFPPKEETASSAKPTGTWFSNVAEDARRYSQREIPKDSSHRPFYTLSTPQKLAVMFGGPVVNLILAVVLFGIVVTGFGTATLTNQLGTIAECVGGQEGECAAGDPPSPAHAAGFEPGDRVLSWGGEEVNSWDDITATIEDGGTSPTPVVIEREGSRMTLTVTPEIHDRPVVVDGEPAVDDAGEIVTQPAPYVGIGPAIELVPQPVTEVPHVVGEVLGGTVSIVLSLPQRLVGIAEAVFTDAERDPSIVGIVGVGRFAGEIASVPSDAYGVKERTADMLSLLGSLNMALFVFNMIPLLPLDGGHIAGALFEGARRRLATWRGKTDPGFADTARLMPLTYVVFLFLIGMSLLLAFADIVKPVTLG